MYKASMVTEKSWLGLWYLCFYKYAIYKEFKKHIDSEYEGYRNHFRFNNLY